jgi:hypothetical protein
MAQNRGQVRVLENTVMDFLFRRKALNELADLLRRIFTAVPCTYGSLYCFLHFRFFDEFHHLD